MKVVFLSSLAQYCSCLYLNLFKLLPARGQVDDEEDVQLDDGGEDEEAGVHDQADDAHLAVQLEFVAEKGHVEQEEGGEEGDGAVLEARRLDRDVVVVFPGWHER